ncbi:TauD/TfdA family dioxygenase [Eionea flava]
MTSNQDLHNILLDDANAVGLDTDQESNSTSLDKITFNYETIHDDAVFLETVERSIVEKGAAIIENYPMPTMIEFSHLAADVIKPLMTYSGGTNSREDLGGGALSVGTEPPHVDVASHNEMSYYFSYPERVMFGCLKCPHERGPTVIADNHQVTIDMLQTAVGQKLWQHGVTYIRNFHNAACDEDQISLRSWQEAFGVQTAAELIQLCNDMGWTHEFNSHGSVRISYTLPAYEFDPVLQQNLFFTSLGNHGIAFDHWAPFNTLPYDERPYHITYGNGDPIPMADLDCFTRVFSMHEIPVHWKAGKVAILDNRRYTHARPVFTLHEGEKRVLGVQMGMKTTRLGQKES